ncbi:hypothetical protein EDB81DRAFT_698417 [Dactylonectria macrodidyma]|uniref:Uncharacterized protein n=1 Tax=Dactylonectria macrodidyma TaxID=307937 RepID=A0A9P9DWW5_9HYPO|nr:hypothetical protein EDB81DRAFT_698417 [Dactylonectria macrodidyma]
MADPISAAAAGTEAVKLCLELVRRVTTAIDLQKTGNSKLDTICNDLNSVRDVVKLVEGQEQLKTKGVLKAVTNIQKITMNVDKHVERVRGKSTAGSKARQITHQFMKGPGEWEILRVMMINLTAAKATLSLHIQLAHVGLMVAQGHGNVSVVNINVLKATNQNVEKFLGAGKGLVIAEVFKDKQPDEKGMIYLTSEECDALPFADIDPSDAGGQPGTIEVLNNRTYDQALQINGLVGEKVWSKFKSNLVIENNEARGFSTQINVPTNKGTWDDALQNRLEMAKIVTAAGGGGGMSQPPPYGQMSYYPAPPPMPGTQWYGQQQNPWGQPFPAAMQGGTKMEDVPRTFTAPPGQQPQIPYYAMYPVNQHMVDPSSQQVNPSTKMETED